MESKKFIYFLLIFVVVITSLSLQCLFLFLFGLFTFLPAEAITASLLSAGL